MKSKALVWVAVALVALVAGGSAEAAEPRVTTIAKWHCAFSLPDGWKLQQSREAGALQAYVYTKACEDAAGRKIFPSFTAIFETTDVRDAVNYSVAKRIAYAFKVDTVFTHEDGVIRLQNAIGYTGTQSAKDEPGHALIVLHAIGADQQEGAQFICEAPAEVMAREKKEYLQILRSIRFLKK